MKIEISRSGGFAGMTRTWSAEISSAEAEEQWLPLLEDADSPNDTGVQRDRYVYRISVGYREVTVTESAMHGRWKDLVERVQRERSPDASPEEPQH